MQNTKPFIRKAFLLILVFFFVLFGSCDKNAKYKVSFPGTTVMQAVKPWAVVDAPLARLYEKPGREGKAVSSVWQGLLVKVIAKTVNVFDIGKGDEYWYQVQYENRTGWLEGSSIILFEMEADAQKKTGDYR